MSERTVSVTEAAALYAEVAVTLCSHSWKTWSRQFVALWGNRPLGSITTGDINGFIAQRRRDGISESTIRGQLQTLKSIFNTAKDLGYPVHYPSRVAKTRVNNERVRYLEGDEEERLRQVMHPDDWRIVELSIATGLRGAELWVLKCEEVDLAKGFLLVKNGKGGKARRVPIGRTARILLEEILACPKTEYLINPIGFERYRERLVAMRSWKTRRWRPALHAAGIKDLHLHDTRHEFATRVVRAGKSLYQLQRVMGHASPQMTMRYSHLRDADLLEVVADI